MGMETMTTETGADAGELPVYKAREVPEPLRTATQLKEQRLKPAEGQQPKGWLRMYRRGHGWGTFPLYDPADAAPMRPLSVKQQAAMDSRRTCPECGVLCGYIVYQRCQECRAAANRAAQELYARTCAFCRRVSAAALPPHPRGLLLACAPCWIRRAIRDQFEREWIADRERTCRGCPGRPCTVVLYSDEEIAAAKADGTWGSRPQRCAPCAAQRDLDQAERLRAEADAVRQAEEARRQHLRDLRAWAAAALEDERVVVLDTETTGLDDDARIVEITVLGIDGTVLLDTLVNPGGEAIPPDASGIHGITDDMVAGAPLFGDVLPRLTEVLAGRRCLIYNAPYDIARLRHELMLHHLDRSAAVMADAMTAAAVTASTVEDAVNDAAAMGERAVPDALRLAGDWLDQVTTEDVMIPYSEWYGDWSDYWGNYSWQPLNGGHRALGDCQAVIRRLGEMAADPGEGPLASQDPWAVPGHAP